VAVAIDRWRTRS